MSTLEYDENVNDKKDRVIVYIGFRGTASTEDALADLKTFQEPYGCSNMKGMRPVRNRNQY